MHVVKTNLLTSKRRVIYRGIRGGYFVRRLGGLRRYGIKAAYRVVRGRSIPIRIVTKSIPRPLVSHRIAMMNRLPTKPTNPMIRRIVPMRPMPTPVPRPVSIPVPMPTKPLKPLKPMVIPRPSLHTISVEPMNKMKSIIITNDHIPKKREDRISLLANSIVRGKQKM